jgi:hypothetical protein
MVYELSHLVAKKNFEFFLVRVPPSGENLPKFLVAFGVFLKKEVRKSVLTKTGQFEAFLSKNWDFQKNWHLFCFSEPIFLIQKPLYANFRAFS